MAEQASAGVDATARPTPRNALVTWLIPTLMIASGPPLGAALGTTAFRMAPVFAIVGGVLIFFYTTIAMTKELNAAAKTDLKGWHVLIPIYGIYWAVVPLRAAMTKAKQSAGKSEARGAVLYFLLLLYALAADLNDLADARG
jgi:NADH:ubiquinone oxidoreductase subunit 6 (subunit J)